MYDFCRLVVFSVLLSTTVGLAQENSLSVIVVENAPRVMLRSAPRVRRQTAIDSVPRGSQLPLIGRTDSWYQVGLADGSKAWISRAYARVATLDDPYWIVDASEPLRDGPSESAQTVSTISKGGLVSLSGREGDWAEIELSDGTSGWIPARAIENALPGSSATSPETESAAAEEPETESSAADSTAASTAPSGQLDEGPLQQDQTAQPGGPDSNGPADAEGKTEAAIPSTSPAATEGEQSEAEEAPALAAEAPATSGETRARIWDFALPIGLFAAAVLVLIGGYWRFRKRKVREIEQLIRAGQGAGGGAIGGEFLKNLREAEAKQARLDKDLRQRLAALRQTVGAGEAGEESDERFAVSRIEEVRKLVLEQQAKVNALSDLLALQNQKLAAAEEENRLLRQLLPRR